MKKLLGCQIFRVFIGALVTGASVVWASSPQISSLTVSSLDQDKAVSARLSLTLDGENYECKAQIKLLEPSILPCGDHRQGMIEFQSFNNLENAVIAVYQPGRQQGFLYLSKRQGETFPANTNLVIITPGYGSLSVFTKYILEPMKGKMTEAQVFEVLPQMTQGSAEINISTLRDKIANREYEAFLPKKDSAPKAKPEPKSAPAPKKEVSEDPVVTTKPQPRPQPKLQPKSQPKKESSSPIIHEIPERKVHRRPRKKTTEVRVYRGTDMEIVEVPTSDSLDDGFAPPSPRRRVIRNPYGYNLRELSQEQIRELLNEGLIYFDEE